MGLRGQFGLGPASLRRGVGVGSPFQEMGQLRRLVVVLSFEVGEVLNEAFTQQLLHFKLEVCERGLGLVHMRVKPQNRRRQLEPCRGGL